MRLRDIATYIFVVLMVPLLGAGQALAEEIKFFESGIDYWSQPQAKVAEPEKQEVGQKVKTSDERNPPAFDWQKVMDPKNDDFFKEGDYVPPAPFMEVARDPSDQNIRLWNAYIEKKNALAARLQDRLQEYAAKNGGLSVAPPQVLPPAKSMEVPMDPKRYQIRMYFESQCPHCKRMMQTLAELSTKGFFVEAKQIDALPFDAAGLPFAFSKASKEEVKRHGISSVPFLLVGDLNDKVVYKMAGYKSVTDIFGEIERGRRRQSPN